MARNPVVTPKAFDEILAWLNPDREAAGIIYVQLRQDLTKIFAWNRCADPEGLTDEVFDRVAKKVFQLRNTFDGNPKYFFHGVARNLLKEVPRKVKNHVPLDGVEVPADPGVRPEEETAELRAECLQSCLQTLSSEKRDLILAYYAKEKQAKIDHRAEMARQLGISLETLRVRTFRIRDALEECIERCLEKVAPRE